MAERAYKAPRNPRIEALRLVAIAGVFVFHTLQPWFEAATSGGWEVSAPLLWALGCLNLLGCFSNHVFYMISGRFLLPRAVADAASGEPGYWGRQARATVRRALPIVVSAALYAAAALFVSAFVTPLEGISLHDSYWLLGGLEFIWVYLALICFVPLLGAIGAHLSRKARINLVLLVVTIVYLVNFYIAFDSPGDDVRGFLEWRKLMSAASYFAGFLLSAAFTERSDTHPGRDLAILCGLTAVAMAFAAGLGDVAWIVSVSYKSTSFLSLGLAGVAVIFAARPCGEEKEPDSPAYRAVQWLSPAVLGAYLGQSMFYLLWWPVVFEATCAAAAWGETEFLAVAFASSLLLLTLMLLIDRITRVYLLKLGKLL